MALLQMLSVKDIPGTFAQLADQILKDTIIQKELTLYRTGTLW
jgi:hypothetical protein